MSTMNIFDVAQRGMSAQLVRMNAASSNLANAGSVASSEEGAYRPIRAVFAEHHQLFKHEMEELVADILARLDREAVVPLEKLTETAIALYLHSLAHEHLGTGAMDTSALVDVVLPQVLIGLSRPVG